MAAAGVLGVVVMAGVTSGGDDGTSSPGSSAEIAGTTLPPDQLGGDTGLTAPQSTVQQIQVDSTLPAIEKSNLAAPIARGSYGGDVLKVQERLDELGFELGPPDGNFGELTQQAVWAYKKLVMQIPREELEKSQSASLITNDTWLAMQDPITIQPRRRQDPGKTHVEIYLPEQVLAVYTDNTPVFIAHVSSGDEQEWCELVTYDTDINGNPLEEPVEKDECGKSFTPGGVFRFNRRYDGNRQSPLGGMYNPVYFNYGIAVHGARNVPLHPASHGCIRIHMELAEVFPGLVKNGNRVYVWGQDGREPEAYGASPAPLGNIPIFNYRNPNSTTTSSSSTTSTSVPKSTTTTTPATTTTKPPATTTATTAAPATTTPPVTTAAPTTAPPATTAAPATAAPTTEPVTVPTP
jgi:hypothetical protein